jgi:MerR family transcriptional regulator, light-induced transcriptional regulator
LLYLHYVTKARGHKCVYLGQSVPLEDLISITKSVKPDVLTSIFTNPTEESELEEYLKDCETALPQQDFYVSGRLLFDSHTKVNLPSKRFIAFKDFNEYKKLL